MRLERVEEQRVVVLLLTCDLVFAQRGLWEVSLIACSLDFCQVIHEWQRGAVIAKNPLITAAFLWICVWRVTSFSVTHFRY